MIAPFPLGGFGLLWSVLPIALIALVAFVIVAVVGRRREADPRGRRPYAVYLLAVMFVSLLTLVAGLGQIGSALASGITEAGGVWAVTVGDGFELGAEHGYGPEGSVRWGPGGSPTMARILRAMLVALPAGAVFVFHRRRLHELVDREAGDG